MLNTNIKMIQTFDHVIKNEIITINMANNEQLKKIENLQANTKQRNFNMKKEKNNAMVVLKGTENIYNAFESKIFLLQSTTSDQSQQ